MPMPEEPRGPTYIATFTDVAIAAAQDLFEITAPAGSRVIIREFEFGQYTKAGDSNAEMIDLQIIRNHGTTGTGGSTLVSSGSTPGICNIRQLMIPILSQTIATPVAQSVVKVNNTGLAVAGGNTIHVVRSTAFNAMGGYRYYPGFRGERIILDFSQRLVFRIPQTPSPTFSANGTLVWQEVGALDQ